MCLVSLQAFLDEVELIAQGLEAIRHSDLSHVGLPDVVTLWTFFEVIRTQEVAFLLERRRKTKSQE